MNRRTFLRILAGTAPVIAVAPTYFFAPKGGWPAAEAARAKAFIGKWLLDQVGNERFDPETAMGQQQFCYIHPAQFEAAQELKFDGMLWVPERSERLQCAATYGGINRAASATVNDRMNEACALMDDYAHRCGAEWTDKPWS